MNAAPLYPASPSASTGRLKIPPVYPAATRLASWPSAAFATRSRSGSPSGWKWSRGPARSPGPRLLLLDDDTPLSVREDAIAVAVLTRRQVVILALLGRTDDLPAQQALQGNYRGQILLDCRALLSDHGARDEHRRHTDQGQSCRTRGHSDAPPSSGEPSKTWRDRRAGSRSLRATPRCLGPQLSRCPAAARGPSSCGG